MGTVKASKPLSPKRVLQPDYILFSRDQVLNCDSMRVRVSGSRPLVFQIVIAYCFPSPESRRKSNHDQRRSILFFLITRSLRGRISQNCRAPTDFNSLRWISLAAAEGIPKGVSSPLTSLQTSMSRTKTILLVVTLSLLEAAPPNPAKTVFGKIRRH